MLKTGEFCVIVGPSGCGKSTLLRIIAGLEEASQGSIHIDGKMVNGLDPSQRGIAMVFQNYALYPHMTVYDNICFGLKMSGVAANVIAPRVKNVAEILELTPYLQRKPKALSGGQRQRVAIARAIIRQPKLFLFDEPLSNLDAALRLQTRYEIAKIHREHAKSATIYVTHDQTEAMTLADRIVLLNSGAAAIARDGSVAQQGSPMQLYHHPANLFVAQFIGSPKINRLDGTVTGIYDHHIEVTLQDKVTVTAKLSGKHMAVGAPITLGVRPENIKLGRHGPSFLTQKIDWVERLGDSTYLFMAKSGGKSRPHNSENPNGAAETVDSSESAANFIIKTDGTIKSTMGESIDFTVAPEDYYGFDQDGRALPRLAAAIAPI